VSWWDENSLTGLSTVYAQRVDGSGAVQWGANGVAMSTVADGIYLLQSIVSDGAGGAIVAWTGNRNGGTNADIYAQRVNGSGLVQWTVNGVELCVRTDDQFFDGIVSDGVGGAIVAWDNSPNVLAYSDDVYAQRVNGSGAALWTANGVAVCTAGHILDDAEMVSDGAGGAIVTWSDDRNSFTTGDDVYAQRLNASGVAQWTLNGVDVCTAPGEQKSPELVSSGVGGAIVAWNDKRSGNYDIYAQRLNASGVAQWIANGAALCTVPGDQSFRPQYRDIASDGAGGAYVTWEDTRSGVADVYAQQVTFSGLAIFPNGVALCTAVDTQYFPAITYTGPFGDAFVTWEDSRSGNPDIYALAVPNTPIGPFVRYVPYPNGLPVLPDPRQYPVHIVFNNVVAAGFTYLDITPAGPSLPRTFVLGDGRYYNLSTTAGTTDNIQVCIKFDPAALQASRGRAPHVRIQRRRPGGPHMA
jgi:hypothetical protein